MSKRKTIRFYPQNFKKEINTLYLKNSSEHKHLKINSLNEELPSLSMQTYIFEKDSVRKRKKQIHNTLKNAKKLINYELRDSSKHSM